MKTTNPLKAVASHDVRSIHEKAEEVDFCLRELERQKTDLITAVSHDFRSPLTTLLGYLELLATGDMGELSGLQHNAISVMQRSTERLSSLIADLLVAAQIETQSLGPCSENVGVFASVSAVTASVSSAQKQVTIESRLERDLGNVWGNREQFELCLKHLLSNALKFSPENGTVVVRAYRAAGTITISVSDDGPGIDEVLLRSIFDPFFRTAIADKNGHPGLGLGLTIVNAIVESHGGSIAVDTKVGKGSIFTLKFPAAMGIAAA